MVTSARLLVLLITACYIVRRIRFYGLPQAPLWRPSGSRRSLLSAATLASDEHSAQQRLPSIRQVAPAAASQEVSYPPLKVHVNMLACVAKTASISSTRLLQTRVRQGSFAGCVPGSLCTRSCDVCSPRISRAALVQELERPMVPPLSGVRTRPLRELPPRARSPRRMSAEEGTAPADGRQARHANTRPARETGRTDALR